MDDYFKDNKASNYKITRNELSGKDFSTKFSVWLSQGFISARQLYKKLKNYESTKGANESTYWIFLNYCGETILDFFILSTEKIYILSMD